MTMRTVWYYQCPNGHEGYIKESENDQPYSKMWESRTTSGLNEHQDKTITCIKCGLEMKHTRTS